MISAPTLLETCKSSRQGHFIERCCFTHSLISWRKALLLLKSDTDKSNFFTVLFFSPLTFPYTLCVTTAVNTLQTPAHYTSSSPPLLWMKCFKRRHQGQRSFVIYCRHTTKDLNTFYCKPYYRSNTAPSPESFWLITVYRTGRTNKLNCIREIVIVGVSGLEWESCSNVWS